MVGQLPRRERRAAWRRLRRLDPLAQWYRVPGSIRPGQFHHARLMFSAIEEAMKIEDKTKRGLVLQLVLAKPLKHRGHGGHFRVTQRTVLGRAMKDRSKY